MAFTDSGWGTANAAVTAPAGGPGDSGWGTARARLLDPYTGGTHDSGWGVANASVEAAPPGAAVVVFIEDDWVEVEAVRYDTDTSTWVSS
jgi:hypothetical protein